MKPGSPDTPLPSLHTLSAELAQTIWEKLSGMEAADVAHTLSREQYLEAIVPGQQHPVLPCLVLLAACWLPLPARGLLVLWMDTCHEARWLALMNGS